jgi:hypothetical protein
MVQALVSHKDSLREALNLKKLPNLKAPLHPKPSLHLNHNHLRVQLNLHPLNNPKLLEVQKNLTPLFEDKGPHHNRPEPYQNHHVVLTPEEGQGDPSNFEQTFCL